MSIGHNGTVATVYNVGKIKESVSPAAKIIAAGESLLHGETLSDISISQNPKKSTGSGKKVDSDTSHSLSAVDVDYLSAVESGTFLPRPMYKPRTQRPKASGV